MDFLARHYEKLILAACLLSLIWCNAAVTIRKTDAQKQTQLLGTQLKDTKRLLTGENILEPIDDSSLDTLNSMLSQTGYKLDLLANGPKRRPALFESAQFVVCKNRDCGYVLPYNTDTCPYCKTAQAPIGKDLTMEDDLDKDGIPDLIEKASLTLNYRYPYDSMQDFDGDGFLNIEEYRAGTDMDDFFSAPELAYMLRCAKPAKRSLPFKLTRVKDSGGDTDQTTWKAVLNLNGKPVEIKLGQDIGNTGYTLIGFADDKRSVTIQNVSGIMFPIELGVQTQEKEYSIDFTFLRGHNRQLKPMRRTAKQMMTPEDEAELAKKRQAARQGNMGMAGNMMAGGMDASGMGGAYGSADQMPLQFTLHENDKFFLEFTPNGTNGSGAMMGAMDGMGTTSATALDDKRVEYYQVLAVEEIEVEASADNEQDDAVKTETKLIVKVQRLSALENGSPVGKPIEIQLLDTSRDSKDYLPMNLSGNAMGGMM